MDSTSLGQIAQWSQGALAHGDGSSLVTNLCTDSRMLRPGDLFVALRGDQFDGHMFIEEAAKRGAIGAIAEDAPASLPPDFGVIRVADSLQALQKTAAEYRRTIPLQVINITGSNGKTSTKDLTACVLAERLQVSKTEGNFNNHIGLPLTILRARNTDQVGIWEIGMNHAGEIAPLAALSQPDVGVITNIGVAHIEFLGSREAIAKEKGSLAEALKPSGYLVLSAEDEFTSAIRQRTRADVILAGVDSGDVQARALRPHFNGVKFELHADGQMAEAELPVPGIHMVRNATLAVAVGRIFGLSLEECAAGIQKLQLTKGRLEQKIVRGIHILDDTYNANPDSMAAALLTLSQMPAAGRRVAVLGRMGELGKESEHGHRSVGEVAAKKGIDYLIGVGDEARWITDAAWKTGMEKVLHVDSVEDGVKALREFSKPGDLVLVKGSRSARMERIVEGLQMP
jgi:UDP-N-acetylmuramoyl-tripeptide--D-alanyl-D-alanine ligase